MGEWCREQFEARKQLQLSKGVSNDRSWLVDTSGGRGVSKLDFVSYEFLVILAKKWKIPCDLNAEQARAVCGDQLFQLTAAGAAWSRLWRVTRHCLVSWHRWAVSLQVPGAGLGHSAYFRKMPSLPWLAWACQSVRSQNRRPCTDSVKSLK